MKCKWMIGFGIAIVSIMKWCRRNKENNTANYPLYLIKDAPIYAQPYGEKIGKLYAYYEGKRQKVIVKKYIDHKWVEVDGPEKYFMKFFHLQVNDTKYEYLVAKERTPLYTESTEKSKKIIDIPFGTRVKILHHNQGEQWIHMEIMKNKNKISGFALAAHFKY